MTRALTSALCERLGDNQHELVTCLTSKANRKGIAGPVHNDELSYRIYKSTLFERLIRADLQVLIDEGLIERLDDEHYRILCECPHIASEKILGTFTPTVCEANPNPESLAREAHWNRGDNGLPGAGEGVVEVWSNPRSLSKQLVLDDVEESVPAGGCIKQPSKPKNDYQLARYYFAEVCKRSGISYDAPSEYQVLRRSFRAWWRQGLRLSFMVAMVDEFGRHSNWCRLSRNKASVVFVSHKAQLITLVNQDLNKHTAEIHRFDPRAWDLKRLLRTR